MVKPVDRIIPGFRRGGRQHHHLPSGSLLSTRRSQPAADQRACGCKAGLVFNPATPLSYLDYVMDKLDVILLMSVNPGLRRPVLHSPDAGWKLREVRQRIDASGY